MSKLVESFLTDALNHAKTPEVKQYLHEKLFEPFLAILLETLAPYILCIIGFWTLILVGIIILLLRRPVVGVK